MEPTNSACAHALQNLETVAVTANMNRAGLDQCGSHLVNVIWF